MTIPIAALNALEQPLWVYLAIPVAAALLGYLTKLLMIEMMFRPLEFKGLRDPWLGWQGQVPRSAAKMAVRTVDSLQSNLLQPEELIAKINVDELLAELEGPLRASVGDIAEEIAERYYPTVWQALPDVGRRALVQRLHDQAPEVTRRLLDELRENLDQVFDLRHTVVETLTKDKRKLTRLFREMGGDSFVFMQRSGLVFGFAIGIVQSLVVLVVGKEAVVPIFGLLIGGLTDWLALQMIFRPVAPRRRFGFSWQGRFHKRRAEITKAYAEVLATDILSPASIIESAMTGPQSDRFMHLIEREVKRAIDRQAPAIARPFVVLATGGERYVEMKDLAAQRMIAELRRHSGQVGDFADRTVDLQALIAERMDLMTDQQYEDLLRPIFKDQEWIVIVLGAALGFAFGELQVHLLLQ